MHRPSPLLLGAVLGLLLVGCGMDFEITPKWRVITNANFLWFDDTNVLETFTFQDNIAEDLGTDLSVGIEYRPLLNDNIIVEMGFAAFLPAQGFEATSVTEVCRRDEEFISILDPDAALGFQDD